MLDINIIHKEEIIPDMLNIFEMDQSFLVKFVLKRNFKLFASKRLF